MHGIFYNQALFDITLRPRTPLLIKAGGEGGAALDPTLPDMNFVRMRRPGREPEVYIPGSSLRGVVRGYAERLLRSVQPGLACDQELSSACFAGKDTTKVDGADAYNQSCYACRLFGNMAVASRVRFGDLYLESEPTLETRYGVAIDRVTGAVAQGPFELEILTDAIFAGKLSVNNFSLGQLSLLAAALLDLSDGLVPMGFGKSKGMGRVEVTFQRFAVRTLQDPASRLLGAGALRGDDQRYQLPAKDAIAWDVPAKRVRGFFEAALDEDTAIRSLLEEVANRWPQEVGG
jgi:CRISPR-associated protein Csm3